MHEGRVPIARLVPALACGFLPIVLTAMFFMFVGGRLDIIPGWLRGLPLVFTVYAGANVVVVALVVGLLGSEQLRALGLALRFTKSKVTLAFLAFTLGVTVFGIVNWSLSGLGLPVVKGMPNALSAPQMLLLFVTVGLVVPFCEELLFRTVWFMGLLQRLPAAVAVVVATAAFAAIHIPHFGVGGMVFISFWTLIPIGLYAYTGDITAPWLMHALNNTFAYVVVPALAIQVPGS
jgi:membrane protease YdiL (CAAX protease family)